MQPSVAPPKDMRRLRQIHTQLSPPMPRVQQHECAHTSPRGAAAASATTRLSSPWADSDGSIRAAHEYGSTAVSSRQGHTKTFGVLSEADHGFFERNGYVLIRNAVPERNLQAMRTETWNYLDMDPADPTSWYREGHTGMVQLYQGQAQVRALGFILHSDGIHPVIIGTHRAKARPAR